MTMSGALIDKLIRAGAVQNSEDMINFTPAFANYLIWTFGTSRILDSTIGDWPAVLAIFDPALRLLSRDEIADTVLLFEYYLHHPEIRVVEK